MIDLEKMNKILNSLEELSKNMAKVNVLTKDFKDALDNTRECIKSIKDYDQKSEELSKHISNLTNELDNIRKDYHKVSSSFEVVETDLKQFSSKLDLIEMEIKKELTTIKDKIAKESKKNKILTVILLTITVGLGIVNLFI